MLTLALAATLVGFVLLVLGLITGTVWLAIACIVVCLLGLGFLIADIVGGRRNADERSLADYVSTDSPADDAEMVDPAPVRSRPERRTSPPDDTSRSSPPGSGRSRPPEPYIDDTTATGRIPVIDADPGGGRRPAASESAGSSSRASNTGVPAAAPPTSDQSLDDYLRSIGATPPPQSEPPSPTGPSPLIPAPPEWGGDPAGSSVRRSSGGSSPNVADRRPDTATTSEKKTSDKSFDPLDPNWHPPPEDD